MTEETVTKAHELIYGPRAAQDVIRAKWPNAEFTDETDCVHEERFMVEIEGVSNEELWELAGKSGFLRSCFTFCLWSMNKREECLAWIKEKNLLKGRTQ